MYFYVISCILPGVDAPLDVHVRLAVVAVAAAADLDDLHVGPLQRLPDDLLPGHVLVVGFLQSVKSHHSNCTLTLATCDSYGDVNSYVLFCPSIKGYMIHDNDEMKEDVQF